jgi:hypothetical protein
MGEREEAVTSTPPPDPQEIERGFRRLYRSFGLRVLAGLLVFVALWFIPLPSKLLAVPFIALGGWLVLVNLKAVELVSRAQHAYRHGPEDDTPVEAQERGERVLHYIGFVLLFIAMIAMIPLGGLVENIVEEGRWVLLFGGSGVLTSSILFMWIRRRHPTYLRNNRDRAASILGLLFGTVLLWILVPAWADRVGAAGRGHVVRYALKGGGSNIKSGSTYLHVFQQGSREAGFRVQVRGRELQAAMGRDSVDLRVGLGPLGFTHVLGVEVPPTGAPAN